MKKNITFLVLIISTLTVSAQDFSIGFDYSMWNGSLITNDADKPTSFTSINSDDAADTTRYEASPASAILSVNCLYPINDKVNLIGSVGYGMLYSVVPLKADIQYSFTDDISANVGMGLWMINDKSYEPIGMIEEGMTSQEKDAVTGSRNEFGLNFGLSYSITDNIDMRFNYNMIEADKLNGMSIGLSYALGSAASSDEKQPAIKEKKPAIKENKKASKDKKKPASKDKKKANKDNKKANKDNKKANKDNKKANKDK